MSDLKSVAPKHPIVVNYGKVQTHLARKTLMPDDPAMQDLTSVMIRENGRRIPSEPGHYSIVTMATPASTASQRRLALLETAYSTLYSFAMQEICRCRVPRYRQLACSTTTDQEFQTRKMLWAACPNLGDSFTARRDHVVLMSARRLDDPLNTHDKLNRRLSKFGDHAATRLCREHLVSPVAAAPTTAHRWAGRGPRA